MGGLKVGVALRSLGLPVRQGLAEAQRLGVQGVEIDAVGDLAPDNLSQSGRREFRHLLRAHDLAVTAVNCPMRRGLDLADGLEPRIEHVRKVLTLSFDLGPRVTIVQAGMIPEKPDDPRLRWLQESLLALGQYGDRIGALLALDTGLEPGERLAEFLCRFDTGGLGANYDPANLLQNGFDPYASAQALAGKIAHAHARDARKASTSRAAGEVALGHGDIDWLRLVSVLEEVEYRGWLTVVREGGSSARTDVAEGVGFLRRLVG